MLYVQPSTAFTLTANIGTPDLTTVGVTIVDARDGSEVVPRSQTGVVETPDGSGIYSVTRPSAPAELCTYIGVFDVDGGPPFVAVEFVVAEEIPYLPDLPEGLLTRIKERIETDISDDELVRMAIEASAEIELRFGRADQRDETSAAVADGTASLAASLPINTSEEVTVELLDANETLAAEELEIEHSYLVRRADGRRWHGRTRLIYTPRLDTPQRDEAIIKLVGLALEYRGGMRADRIGDVSNTYAVWAEERNLILRELTPRKGLLMF